MTRQAEKTSVRAQVVVEAPIERAFQVFTEGIGSWFPPEYNILAVKTVGEKDFYTRIGVAFPLERPEFA